MDNDWNWDFRPASYYFEDDWRGEVLSQIDGQLRRNCAEAELARTGVETYEDYVSALIDGRLDPTMFRKQTAAEKQALGAIHPALMGGEYLPGLRNREVEIVRVSLRSTLADCISVRARFAGGRYHYRIEDEYDTEFDFMPRTSRTPLTFRKLVDLIDSASILDSELTNSLHDMYLRMNLEQTDEPESLLKFVSVDSYLYQEIADYYRQRSLDLVNERRAELSGNDDQED